MVVEHILHHVVKTSPRGKAPMGHLNGETVQKPIPQQQIFQHDKFNQNPSATTQKFSITKHIETMSILNSKILKLSNW